MSKTWRAAFSPFFSTFLLLLVFLVPSILFADDINEVAYQNRFLLKAGTVLNNEGKGDCLIFPYYDARNADGKKQATEINIENLGENGIAAKLRFREWSRGAEVFSKDIWIPSSGVWSGRIESSEDGTNAIITSTGDVIRRNDANSFYLNNPLSGGVFFSTQNIRRMKGASVLYGYFEVIGEEKTSTENINGAVGRLAKSERDCPNTLRGKAFIHRIEDGLSMAYDAVAIGNFSRGQGSLFRSPGSPYPRLDNCEDTLDQLEFQLSKWEAFGPYSVGPYDQEKTSLIVTFPTKQFHYQNGTRVSQLDNPFEGFNEGTGEPLKTTLSRDGNPLPADSVVTLPFSVNVIGLYKDYFGSPMGIDNLSLPTFSYEFGEVKLTSDNLAQRALIEDYEYLQERFTMYRGLPAVGLVLYEYYDPDQPQCSMTPIEFSAVWEASSSESVFLPTLLSGPTSGQTGMTYTFTTGGSASSLGHPIQYFIDWGDGSNSGWLDVGVTSASHSWANGGTYTVRTRARCTTHTNMVSNWSAALSVTITGEVVSTPIPPSGPTLMVVNKDESYPFDKSYTFTSGGSASNLGHPVEYQFDWKGDGSDLSAWGSFIQSKTWTQGATLTIRARARCATHTSVVSNWSVGLAVAVEAVSAPNVLSGPSSVIPNISCTYSAGGAKSNLGHQVQYFFDWGDGTNSGWLPAGVTSTSKAWTAGATDGYKVKARARCAADVLAVSDWTPELTVNVELITSPTTPAGPNKGQPGVSYSYSTGGAFSSLGDPVEYQFDWNGDGLTDLSPWGPGTQSKTWTAGGNFSVKARARCITHPTAISSWSTGLTVNIEKISTPTTPSGTAAGVPYVPYLYTTGGSTSSTGDPVQYRFLFSDGGDSGWLPVGMTSFYKSWSSLGTFTVSAQARCATHTNVESNQSGPLSVRIELTITAPATPTATPANVSAPVKTYDLSTGGSTCSDGGTIDYRFDWNDGALSPWGSGNQSHTWTADRTYSVKAQARCANFPSVESQWSSGVSVTIPAP